MFCFVKLYQVLVGVIMMSLGLMPVFKDDPKRNTDLYYHKGQSKLEHICGHRLQHNKDKSVIIGTVNLTIFF